MIQRIQSVYLALVAILSFSSMLCPLLTFYQDAQQIAQLNNWYLSADVPQLENVESLAPLALGGLLIFVGLLSLTSIMLFRYRMRQLRLTIFSTLMLLGYIALYAFLAFKFSSDIDAAGFSAKSLSFHVATIFPLLSIIFNLLAIHGIRKDERLVRSLDRIR